MGEVFSLSFRSGPGLRLCLLTSMSMCRFPLTGTLQVSVGECRLAHRKSFLRGDRSKPCYD